MNCPHDGIELLVAHRSGIEIDICPTCRGVWLDRGELNKLITLATDQTRPLRPPSFRPLHTRTSRSARPDGPTTSPTENWLADVFDDTDPPLDHRR
ncbi:zf-TFIIB domain-containing protein [Microbacterium sp. NPDC057407]|uniref:TFIIB-type zinc ribbon-containing protein n=1 Tax=Microbacterium sp. NPDC057407 TaxID=3346120 RepID=UPI00366FDA77